MAEKEKDPCPECTTSAGIGVVLSICEQAEVDVEDVKKDLLDQKITVQKAVDEIKSRLKQKNDDFSIGLVEDVETIMIEQLKEQNKQMCVSIVVKQEVEKKIGEWVEDRKKALEGVKEDSEFAKGTKELIENLEYSRAAIDKLPTCEEK